MNRPALLLLAALCLPGLALADDANRRSISVNGQGEVSVKPDRAMLSLGVEATGKELKPVQDQVNKVVRDYLAEAKKQGIKDEQISTAGMSINPEYVWDDKARRQIFNGYHASRQIVLRVDDLDKIGTLIISATQVGVNQVSTPQLYSTKAKELQRGAMVAATQDARGKAQLLADTLGVKLGAVRSLSANDGAPPPVVYAKAMMAAAPAADGNTEMGFSAGEIKYSANVSAEFDVNP